MKHKPNSKWRDIKQKRFDFSQIKGDFVNMIELEQYKRENTLKNICSSIFVSIHLGYQLVLWELSNYPKIKIKMLWFYLLEESHQAYSLTELQPMLQLANSK